MLKALVTLVVAALCTLAFPALAQDDGGWELVVEGPITVKNRALEGTAVKEIWAEGELDAPPLDVQDALMDVPSRWTMPASASSHCP